MKNYIVLLEDGKLGILQPDFLHGRRPEPGDQVRIKTPTESGRLEGRNGILKMILEECRAH